MVLTPVRCVHCNKLLLEAFGEVKKICPNCKKITHIVVTTCGIIDLEKLKNNKRAL